MEKGRNVHRVLLWRPEGKKPLRKPRGRWGITLIWTLGRLGIDRAIWIRLPQDREQWWAL
jgi:hypothetical protein